MSASSTSKNVEYLYKCEAKVTKIEYNPTSYLFKVVLIN